MGMNTPKVTLTRMTPLLPDVKRTSKQNAVMKDALRNIATATTCCLTCRVTQQYAAEVLEEVEKI